MKKSIVLMVAWFVLNPLAPTSFDLPEAHAETRVTIRFAAGGVACGVFFFVHLVFRSSLALDPGQADGALFTYDPAGWQTAPPTLNLFREERTSRMLSIPSAEMWHVDLVRFRF